MAGRREMERCWSNPSSARPPLTTSRGSAIESEIEVLRAKSRRICSRSDSLRGLRGDSVRIDVNAVKSLFDGTCSHSFCGVRRANREQNGASFAQCCERLRIVQMLLLGPLTRFSAYPDDQPMLSLRTTLYGKRGLMCAWVCPASESPDVIAGVAAKLPDSVGIVRDAEGRVRKAYGVGDEPANFLVDRQGRLSAVRCRAPALFRAVKDLVLDPANRR